jgi:SagB-type dehydrogenase family enzyme
VTATTTEAERSLSAAEVALAYHTRTKHKLERFATGPETLDWDAQPNAFREFEGAPRTQLPLVANQIAARFAQIHMPGEIAPAPHTLTSISALLELSFGLSAWKEYGPDRWALRCNPSSGNLHPTEAYLLARNVSDLDDGIYHYLSRDHALEQRCRHTVKDEAPAQIWIGLSSVHWREAWKYGERAFRYCQLDIGHALGAVWYAARTLGWEARLVEGVGSAELATLMGLDRAGDFAGAEREDPDLLIAIHPGPAALTDELERPVPPVATGEWTGKANLLDPHPMYRWPIIDEVSEATHGGDDACSDPTNRVLPQIPSLKQTCDARAAQLILGRRSAQRFDAKTSMDVDTFHHMLECLLVRPTSPWDLWSFSPRLHPIFFVHRVEGLEPGLYALPRHEAAADSLRQGLRDDFEWKTSKGTPEHLPFFRLLPANCRAIAKTVSCHQAIASDGCFSLSMISEFEATVPQAPWRYRQLHWEAGLLGQVLYLEAEAAGLRGTGIGCYFDDGLHSLLGITTMQFQALYHFTVGHPVTDARIMTLPAYPGRQEPKAEV